jgi:hypothetical protein
MVSISQAKQGANAYVNNEIISRMAGWQKWVAGAAVAVATARAEDIFAKLKDHPVVTALGVVDADGMIDIDVLHRAFAEQARTSGPISIDIPAFGTIAINAEDVDNMARYIRGEG